MIKKINAVKSDSEKDFVKEWVRQLTACDERLVCDMRNFDEQFSDKANRPKFTITVLNAVKIIFTRSDVLENSVDSYGVEIKSGDNVGILGEFSLCFGQKANANAKSVREWDSLVVSGEQSVAISLKDNSGFYKAKVLAVNDGTVKMSGAVGGDSGILPSFEQADCPLFYIVGGGTVKAKHRMDYVPNELGVVETLTNKVFVEANDAEPVQQRLTTSALWDCSTVGSGWCLTVDGEEYYAVDCHTLIPLRKEV